jgi:Raf kinase inhibitor-like YbhB/YbcL family protein
MVGGGFSAAGRISLALIVLGLVAGPLVGCGSGTAIIPEEGEMTMSVSSPAFQEGESIPLRYTCEGEDISPQLTWSEPPAETQSLALIVDDPDAPGGVFTHWVLFNLPSDSRRLPEAVTVQEPLPSGVVEGENDFGRIGYGGPCPPPGSPHRYRFTLYALDKSLKLAAGVAGERVIEAMSGHILAWGRLTGTYQR